MRRISIDGGKSFCNVETLINYLSYDDEDIDLDTLGYYMGKDENAFSQVMTETEKYDYTLTQLIERFLELTTEDLIITEV